MHYLILIIAVLMLLYGPQLWVQYILNRYNRKAEENFTGTGGELARHLLDRYGLESVTVEKTELGDHYDPLSRSVRLSADKYDGKTLTAITVAAHETGHALQHAVKQPMFQLRTRLAVIAVQSGKIGMLLLVSAPFLALLTRAPAAALVPVIGAVLMMGTGVVVQLITLPVELDASFNKALPILKQGYLREDQFVAAHRILRAAAWTYVAASLASLLNFGRWLMVMRR
jgi:Zn-dependent membrane protease YugP